MLYDRYASLVTRVIIHELDYDIQYTVYHNKQNRWYIELIFYETQNLNSPFY
jgi:hypothetical protein